jgi:protein-disulfide isomerase
MDINRKLFFGTLATLVLYVAFTLPMILEKGKDITNYVSINGKKYTEEDLQKKSFPSYKAIRKDYNAKLNQVFESFAREEVLKMEASSHNQTVEQFVKASLTTPQETEIVAVYQMYKDKLGGKSLEQARPSIVEFLTSQKREEFISKVMDKYSISVVTEKPERQTVQEKSNPFLGPKDAKVTIIEFSDFECPFCQKSQDVNKILREKYKGKIKWVFRDYPLPFHGNAMFAHIAANCANKQGKYWEYFEELFQNTGNLSREKVLSLAAKVGLNSSEFNKCAEDASGEVVSEIQSDINDGKEVGVNGTPAFFINGIMLEGAQPLQNFEKIIEEELKK